MIELFELFNKINNLQSSLSFESQPRYARPLTRFDSIHRLDAKSLILNTASMDSTNSAHNILGGPPLDAVRLGKPFLTDDEVSPLDETALARQLKIPSNVRLETSRLGPMMTGPTRTEDRRGLKLQHSYHRDREFPRSPEGART